jgi:YVTN family beta-propeller protein
VPRSSNLPWSGEAETPAIDLRFTGPYADRMATTSVPAVGGGFRRVVGLVGLVGCVALAGAVGVAHAPGDMAEAATSAEPTVYVSNQSSNNVTPIAVATNTPGPPIPVGIGPAGVAVTPDGATAYVTNFSSNNVTPIAVATNTPGPPIPVGIGPAGVAITPDQAPVAALSVSPGPAGTATTFDASASTVAHGTIASYEWDFGDATPPVTTTTPVTTHVYAQPGAYTVTVTETSSAGTSTTQVFTGQTMSRNGGPSAVTSVTFQVVASSSSTKRGTQRGTHPAAVTPFVVTPRFTG